MNDTITSIRITDLHESPFNPRKTFDDAALQELATDIKAQGRVLQPLLVRPRLVYLCTQSLPEDGFEIVFGHRRYRAAALAGLDTVPCMVRAMTDDEARAAQISENLSRQDVHPIEEAEGFQALLDSGSHTADEIAAQFGKSRSYVYGRLKLLQACPVIRNACLAGQIGSEVALLVARLRTPKLQEKALQAIGSAYADMKDGGAKSYRQIRALLAEKFTLDLRGAIFDTEEEMLLPSAGNCVTCPKRSANAPEYADLVDDQKSRHGNTIRGSADTCTDPDCFEAKKKAHLQREAARLQAAGKVVVQGAAARAAISATGEIKGGYIALKDVRADLKKLSAKKTVAYGDPTPQTITIQDPRTGKLVEVVKASELQAAGVATKKEEPKRSSSYGSADYAAERKRKEAEAERKSAGNLRLFKAVREAQRQTNPGMHELRALAACMLETVIHGTEDCDALLDVWEVPNLSGLLALANTLDAAGLTRLVLDCVLIEHVTVASYELETEPEPLLDTAAVYGIDADAVRAEAPGGAPTPESAARAPTEAEAAPAGAKGKPKAKGKALRADQGHNAGDAGGSGALVAAFEGDEA